jgi:aminoglycoside 3-N-acetyltransferase
MSSMANPTHAPGTGRAAMSSDTTTVSRATIRRGAINRVSLAADLHALGIEPGESILVHASLRAIGGTAGVQGGASAVAGALSDVLGPQGTIVVYTATMDNSRTSHTHLASVWGMSKARRRRHRRQKMPGYDKKTTRSTGMGVLAEQVRTSRGAKRSAHPQTSFAAIGPAATQLVEGHAPDCHLGERSPLARLYDAGARILLLGVGYDRCTALHLAEYRYTTDPPTRLYRCVIIRDGKSKWWSYQDVVLDDRDFAAIGSVVDQQRYVMKGLVGCADSRLIPMREAVNLATGWLAATRKG